MARLQFLLFFSHHKQILSIQKETEKQDLSKTTRRVVNHRKKFRDNLEEEFYLREVTQSMPHVDSLNLRGCFSLTDDKLTPAFQTQLPFLMELNLGMCRKISDQSISSIVKSALHLQVLDLGGCASITNKSLDLIHNNLHLLKHLNLRSCLNVTDSGIAKLCGQVPCLLETEGYPSQQDLLRMQQESPGYPCLETLGLQDCQKLTDNSLKFVSLGLKNLKSINLSFCASFTEFGLKFLSSMACGLKEVNLRSCDNVSDSGLKYLSEGGVALHVLDVSFCDKITDQGLVFISQGLPQIRSLSLNSCTVTDAGLIKLSQTLTDLKTLNIGQCSRVTDKGLNAIINNCPHLSSLDIYGCPSISHYIVDRLMTKNVTLSRDLWPDSLISPEDQQPQQTDLTESTSNKVSTSTTKSTKKISSSTTTEYNNNSFTTMNAMSHHNLQQFWLHLNSQAFGLPPWEVMYKRVKTQ
jgi:F-box/leucine-rich repeat protein 14